MYEFAKWSRTRGVNRRSTKHCRFSGGFLSTTSNYSRPHRGSIRIYDSTGHNDTNLTLIRKRRTGISAMRLARCGENAAKTPRKRRGNRAVGFHISLRAFSALSNHQNLDHALTFVVGVPNASICRLPLNIPCCHLGSLCCQKSPNRKRPKDECGVLPGVQKKSPKKYTEIAPETKTLSPQENRPVDSAFFLSKQRFATLGCGHIRDRIFFATKYNRKKKYLRQCI